MRGFVYTITAHGSVKVYVGLTISPLPITRFYKHLSLARRGRHPNRHLQNFILKHGSEIVFSAAHSDDVSADEIRVADEQQSNGMVLLNLVPRGGLPPSLNRDVAKRISDTKKGHSTSPETRARISMAMKGRVSNRKGVVLSEATRSRMADSARRNWALRRAS